MRGLGVVFVANKIGGHVGDYFMHGKQVLSAGWKPTE